MPSLSRLALTSTLLLSAAASAQIHGDLAVANGPGLIHHQGPFIACGTAYEAYAAVRADGGLFGGGLLALIPPPPGSFIGIAGATGPSQHVLLLRDDGEIIVWGNASSLLAAVPPGPFTAVASGANTAIALRPDGTIVQWGAPMPAPPAGTFTKISAGLGWNVAIRTDGTLAAWGNPANPAVLTPPTGAFIDVSAGAFGVGVRASRTLAAWGDSDPIYLNTPPGQYYKVSAGFGPGWPDPMALRSDNAIVQWGPGFHRPFSGTYFAIASGQYSIAIVARCYPNCDDSTAVPTLNVADFTCYLQKFAAGDPYANCDQSTNPPVLNIADFTCFNSQFATGCP